MDSQLRMLRSKQNLLNAHIANLNDSGLFSPEEIAEQIAPIIPQIQDLEEQIRAIKDTANAEFSTPQTVN